MTRHGKMGPGWIGDQVQIALRGDGFFEPGHDSAAARVERDTVPWPQDAALAKRDALAVSKVHQRGRLRGPLDGLLRLLA